MCYRTCHWYWAAGSPVVLDAHEHTHVFGLVHGQDPNDITNKAGGNGQVSDIAARVIIYANTIQGQQQTQHIK